MILGYPVVLSDEKAHAGPIEHVSGSEQGSEDYLWFGLDGHVDSETPPTFMWHTTSDGSVPVENSLKFSLALSAAKVPFECHVFPSGGHGMSTCRNEVNVTGESYYNARWMEWSIQWLNQIFDYEL